MNDWLLWLSVDLAGDVVYGREMRHLDGQTSDVVDSIRAASFPSALSQIAKKIPLIALPAPLFVPLRVMRCLPAIYKSNSAAVKARIDKRGKTKHPDFMDFMVRPEDPPPATEKELKHVELVALQLFVGVFDPFQVSSKPRDTLHSITTLNHQHLSLVFVPKRCWLTTPRSYSTRPSSSCSSTPRRASP